MLLLDDLDKAVADVEAGHTRDARTALAELRRNAARKSPSNSR
jgi:hypothetical protein